MSAPVIIVSGLPRSGTSLLMAMLQAGGVPLLTDGQRVPDEDNPRGYFELEAVKRLASTPDLLDQAAGHAVKIVAPLLRHLPPRHRYQIIFMERDPDEVIASQAAMLARKGTAPTLPPATLRTAYQRLLTEVHQHLARLPHHDLLLLNHRDVILDPHAAARKIATFLHDLPGLQTDAMAQIVDPTLHRQRVAPVG